MGPLNDNLVTITSEKGPEEKVPTVQETTWGRIPGCPTQSRTLSLHCLHTHRSSVTPWSDVPEGQGLGVLVEGIAVTGEGVVPEESRITLCG